MDSMFTCAFTSAKNLRFNPESTRAKQGGNDAIAKDLALAYDESLAEWHVKHMAYFRKKLDATTRAEHARVLSAI